jgi:serine/threonine-protein kinase RsbW
VTENETEAVVSLEIPRKAEYVGVARLAILGVASRMRFSYDEVEDIRLAVGEACTAAVERAGAASNGSIRIRCGVGEDSLSVEVADDSPPENGADGDDADLDEKALSGVLIRILMDDVDIDARPGTTVVRMVKRVAR